MYIPNLNLITDRTEAVEFMKRFSFATIITAKNNLPIDTYETSYKEQWNRLPEN